jgi:hypothetical protein
VSKKKGYPRKAYSIERTLKDLVDEIGYEEVEKAINKKKSSIQNISNPLYKERQLSHQDAIDLDIHCKKLGIGTPFLTSYETLLEKYTVEPKNDFHEAELILTHLVRIGESIGDVMEETRKALNDQKIDDSEKEKVASQIIKLEKKISTLKLKLDLGSKTDYTKAKKREF